MTDFTKKDAEYFVQMSKFAGERFDLIQAGGGNASVKIKDGLMLIKTSGCSMSEVRAEHGCAKVRHGLLKEIVAAEAQKPGRLSRKDAERSAAAALESAAEDRAQNPSIEMFMHAVLGKYVLHTHPLTVVAVASRDGWKEIIGAAFPDALLIEYHTPGIELAVAISREIEKRGVNTLEKLIAVFLENHGLIVSGGNYREVIATTEAICAALEPVSGIDVGALRTTTEITAYVHEASGAQLICREAADACILNIAASRPELLFEPPFCPDSVVYNGPSPLNLLNLCDQKPLKSFIEKYGEPPRIIIYRGRIFFIAPCVRAAMDMESALKFHLLVLSGKGGKTNPLHNEEIKYLGGWEAEKRRRNI
ncbi:MAG: class II aldolase/adducin family protein [bacterium]